MRARTLLVSLVGTLLVLSSRVMAGEPPPADAAEAHRRAAQEMYRAAGGAEAGEAGAEAMMVALKDNPAMAPYEDIFRAWFKEVMSEADLEAQIVKLYMDAFSEQELRDLTAFYRTPLGRKSVQKLPELMKKGAEIGMAAAREHAPELQEMISKRRQELEEKEDAARAEQRLDEAMKELNAAKTDDERFYALNDAAKASFNAGKVEDARKYAEELMAMLPQFEGDWNYGNAVHDANLVLGRIALKEGRVVDAKDYLLEAGKSPGSPQMDSFGPNMTLAEDLLEEGERDVVLEYFSLCRKFWEMGKEELDQWTEAVKAEKMPDFGANLDY